MKLNSNVKIVAKKCILVPYEPCHVAKYHKWMENEEIRRLTGSEQLSLDEEYEMQKTWRNDEDKLTFIVLEMNESGEEVGIFQENPVFFKFLPPKIWNSRAQNRFELKIDQKIGKIAL